jgi:cytochrome b
MQELSRYLPRKSRGQPVRVLQDSSPASEAGDKDVVVPVWDLPVRVGHWSLVLLVVFSWFTGTYGSLVWHRWSGYAILVLVLFRIYWGFAGSGAARFSHFLRGPRAVWAYSKTLLTRLRSRTAGHNPLGGWSIIAMLGFLFIESSLGLFAVDVDGLESGPLSDMVSFETGRKLANWHGMLVNALLVLIAFHIAAILHYWLHKHENLIAPMLNGVKRLPPGTAPTMRPVLWRAVLGFVLAGLLVIAVVTRLRFS